VYCSFDPHFRDSFAKIIDEWGRSMLKYAKWTKWTAGRTPSIQWKDPEAVANEPFLSPGHGDDEEEFFKTRTSTSGLRLSFSGAHSTQLVNENMRKPEYVRDFSNETQRSEFSNHSPQSSSSTKTGRGSTEERNPVPVTENVEARNLPFSTQATRRRTDSSSAVIDEDDLEQTRHTNSGAMNENVRHTQPQRYIGNAPLGFSSTSRPTELLESPYGRENLNLSSSRSTTAPERVEDQELRLRGWRSPDPDVLDAVASHSVQNRTEEAPGPRLRRKEGRKWTFRGKGDTPGEK
jgi:hypothetical protein